MKKIIRTILIIIFFEPYLIAQVEIPHRFQAGQPAKAEEVNENFAALKKAIEEVSRTGNHFQGNVGIGTNSPNAKLSLGNDISGTKLALYDQSSENMYGLGVTAGMFRLHVNNPKARFSFLDKVDGNEIFTVRASGSVGIQEINPRFNLHVNGTAGKPGGGSWATASDVRLKDIHDNFTKGLSALNRLNPVTYQYKKDNSLRLPTDKIYVGLIAQEVQEVIPEAIGEYDQGYLSLTSDPIILAMLNAIKELHLENTELKQNLVLLKKELNDLKSEVLSKSGVKNQLE
ncbi:hypothetical protein BH23BAC1_BH23BAC1_17910 [soil metagenome]